MGNVDCALTTEGYGDYDKKLTQYSWFVHELLEKEFFGKIDQIFCVLEITPKTLILLSNFFDPIKRLIIALWAT